MLSDEIIRDQIVMAMDSFILSNMPSPETQLTQIGFVFNFFTAVIFDPVLIFDCQDKAS